MHRMLAPAARAGTAARVASASARRRQIAQLRTTLEMHKFRNHHHRRQVTASLARLKGTCLEFRRQVRRQLHLIAARVAAKPG